MTTEVEPEPQVVVERSVIAAVAEAPAPAAPIAHVAPAPVAPLAATSVGPAAIDRLFQLMCQAKASDLHLCVGMPPLVRKDGEIAES